MHRIFAILALIAVTAHCSAATPRSVVYARQLDCTVSTTRTLGSGIPADYIGHTVARAVDKCVTPADMKTLYHGLLKYEDRNPATVRHEMDARKLYVFKAALRRLDTHNS
jgi:hypothetical protein